MTECLMHVFEVNGDGELCSHLADMPAISVVSPRARAQHLCHRRSIVVLLLLLLFPSSHQTAHWVVSASAASSPQSTAVDYCFPSSARHDHRCTD